MTGWRPEADSTQRVRAVAAVRRSLAALVGALALLLGVGVATSAAAAPVNDFPPEVVGNPLVGERLLCGAGSWSGTVSKFNFEWLREGIPVGSGVGYIVKPADEGYRLWCAVTAIHEEPFKPPENTRAESFNSVLIPGKAPTSPTPSEPPLLSGQPAVNETLSCSTGGWSGNPQPTFTYQWLRDPGPEETLIEAATKPTYTVSSEDRGHALACRVTAHNSAGSASSLSNSVSIPGTGPVLEVPPRVLGVAPAQLGEMLACAGGKWSGSPKPRLTYQWFRDREPITSATASSYTVEAADQLHLLSCVVTATNNAGSAEAPSSNSIGVRGSKPQNTEAPKVAGSPLLGSTLTCEHGEWSGVPTPALSYLWVRNLGLLGEEAVGVTANYEVVEEDAGKPLSCEVTARNSEGEASQSSEAVVVPTGHGGSPPANTTQPEIVGEGKLGASLTCQQGSWTGTPQPTLTYQWLRGEARGGGGEPSYALIAGATEAKYRVTEADQGYLLKCRVTATNEEGTAHSDSREALQTAGVAPHDLEAPQVIGTAEVNESLTCLHGAWSGAPKPALSVQWLRNGSPIGGASESSYTVTGEDRGASVSCRVTASNSAGAAEAVSQSVQIHGNQPQNGVLPEVIGRTDVGDVLTCLPGGWSGKPSPSFTYQWLLEGAEIPSATGNTYTIAGVDRGLALSCRVTASNREGSSSASSKPVHVRGIKPEDIEAPRVSGGSSVGAEAKCVPGVWNGKPPPMFTYQWLRDGAVISSATSSVYRVELADEGHVLSCAVTATNGEGSAEAQSSNGLTIPRPAIAESKVEPILPPVGQASAPTVAQILSALHVQLRRMQHHVHLATLRKTGAYPFPFFAPDAGTLEVFWYEPLKGAHRSARTKPVLLAIATAKFSSAGTKMVKLVLTAVARRLIRNSSRIPLSIKAVFVRPREAPVTWTSSYLLSH